MNENFKNFFSLPITKIVCLTLLIILFLFGAYYFPVLGVVPFIVVYVSILFFCFDKIIKNIEDRDITSLDESSVEKVQLNEALKVLRIAATCLAFISFMTTAGGLNEFVFTNLFQAYLASFAIQGILVTLSFLFFDFYIKLQKSKFPSFFKYLMISIMIFLYIGVLTLSSTFSYVFIANNTYVTIKDKNSNVTIEKFLVSESTNLKKVNQEVGKTLKKKLINDLDTVKTYLEKTETENNKEVGNELSTYKFTLDMNTKNELNDTDTFSSELEEEGLEAQVSVLNGNEEKYKICYSSYASSFEYYKNIFLEQAENSITLKELEKDFSETNRKQAKNEVDREINKLNLVIRDLEAIISSYDDIKNNTDSESLAVIIAAEKTSCYTLKTSIQTLVDQLTEISTTLGQDEENANNKTNNMNVLNELTAILYSDDYNPGEIDELCKKITLMITENLKSDENTIQSESLDILNTFTENLSEYKKYLELNDGIDNYMNNEINKSYILVLGDEISKEENRDPLYAEVKESGGIVSVSEMLKKDNIPTENNNKEISSSYYVTQEKWRDERRRHFSLFIDYLKKLPNLQAILKTSSSSGSQSEGEILIRYYNQEKVFNNAYAMNRDLLEPITDFESAFNYFKYDFRMVAWFALIIALFLDLGALFIGCFMFMGRYFKNEEE